jgi:hypothetical protein
MQYFKTLPKLVKTNSLGHSILLTNLMARSSIIPSLLNNAALYYQYDIQEGDTPESIAYKYYGESYRYWIVLFANQIIDPQWQWPMNSQTFAAYLNDKYPSTDVYATIHSYQQITTSVDSITNIPTTNTITIDESTYNSLLLGTNSYKLPNESTVTVTVDRKAVSIYDYELGLNESNRSINLLNANFVNEIEEEFQRLMSK